MRDVVFKTLPSSKRTLRMAYATHDGTARAGEDYTDTSGTLTFAAGETKQTVTVPLLADDDADEGEETLTLVLSDAAGAGIARAAATGTIRDHEASQAAGICGRTPAVRDAILGEISGVTDYRNRVRRRLVRANELVRGGYLKLAARP